jgi:hypothetical protein
MYYSVTNHWHYLSRISISLVFIKIMRVAILKATKPSVAQMVETYHL